MKQGFRKIQSTLMSSSKIVRSTTASGSVVYESDRAVNEYLVFHYGSRNTILPFTCGASDALDFPARCANICAKYYGYDYKGKRALDVGCAVGGSTFELARNFEEVVGVDFSSNFVNAANTVKKEGKVAVKMLKQGENYVNDTVVVDERIDRGRVSFIQGDACNLAESLGQFDVILASNLLCRLPSPRKFLVDAINFLRPNGILVLISPYSWLEEYTVKDEWIGALEGRESGNEVIKFVNSSHKNLELIHEEEVPFLIREHERKYQYGVSNCKIWRRK